MDVKISLDLLGEIGKKHPMFWHAAMSSGTIEGDKLRISQQQFQALCQEHFGGWALGNLIHEVVAPVAKAIGKEDCSDCAERQLKLNAL